MDNQRFELAKELAAARGQGAGIGTLSEKTLHSVLKFYFEPEGIGHEVKIGPYVADIVGENGIIEIQTGGFSQIRDKLSVFLSAARVTLVHPIARMRWICWSDQETGEVSPKRKSPAKGSEYSAFSELYRIKTLLTHPNLSLCLMLVDVEEYRRRDRSFRRGYTRVERIPVALADEIYIGGPEGFSKLIPPGLPERFTSREFAAGAGIRLSDAQTALNVLNYTGVVIKTGKRGRLWEYERTID